MAAHWIRDGSAVEPNTGFVALLDICKGWLSPLRQQKSSGSTIKFDGGILTAGKDERNPDTNIRLETFVLVDLPMRLRYPVGSLDCFGSAFPPANYLVWLFMSLQPLLTLSRLEVLKKHLSDVKT